MKSLLITLCASLLLLTGCPSIPNAPRNVQEAIDYGYTTVDIIAGEAAILCGHTVTGGPCQSDAIITTETKADVKGRLNQAYARLEQADVFLANGDLLNAESKADQAAAILTAIRALLAEHERVAEQPEPGV